MMPGFDPNVPGPVPALLHPVSGKAEAGAATGGQDFAALLEGAGRVTAPLTPDLPPNLPPNLPPDLPHARSVGDPEPSIPAGAMRARGQRRASAAEGINGAGRTNEPALPDAPPAAAVEGEEATATARGVSRRPSHPVIEAELAPSPVSPSMPLPLPKPMPTPMAAYSAIIAQAGPAIRPGRLSIATPKPDALPYRPVAMSAAAEDGIAPAPLSQTRAQPAAPPAAAEEATALLGMLSGAMDGAGAEVGAGASASARAEGHMPAAAATPPPAALSASIDARVIDMSAGGQWIDGLAREIATLSAGTGQGSFRLSPEHLGPMRVNIRPGEAGSVVTMTVETKAAENALVKDKGALQADARLAGADIADVKIERVTALADPPRGETMPQQGGGQNPQSQAQFQSQQQHQQHHQQHHQQQAALAQGNGGDGAGNSPPGRKLVNEDAVSKGAETGDPRAPDAPRTRRARYA